MAFSPIVVEVKSTEQLPAAELSRNLAVSFERSNPLGIRSQGALLSLGPYSCENKSNHIEVQPDLSVCGVLEFKNQLKNDRRPSSEADARGYEIPSVLNAEKKGPIWHPYHSYPVKS